MAEQVPQTSQEATNGKSQAFRPTINWNGRQTGAIRTNLRGSRAPTTHQSSASLRTNIQSTGFGAITTPTGTPQEGMMPTTSAQVSTAGETAVSPAPTPMEASIPDVNQPLTSEPPAASTLASQEAPVSVNPQIVTNEQASSLAGPSLVPDTDYVESSLTTSNLLDMAKDSALEEGRRLYIGNLDFRATEEDLREFFKGFSIESVTIPTNPRTSRSVGHAFVTISNAAEAELIISQSAGSTILDREISIQRSRATNSSKELPIETEDFKAGNPIRTPWSELIARAKAGLNTRQGGEGLALKESSVNKPTAGNQEDAPSRVPDDIHMPNKEENQRRPGMNQAAERQTRDEVVISSSDEEDNRVILNLAPEGSGDSVRRPSYPSTTGPFTGTRGISTIPAKRSFESFREPVGDDFSEEGETGSILESKSSLESENIEEEKFKRAVAENIPRRGEQSEEGEVTEVSENEDPMLAEYSNSKQQAKEPNALNQPNSTKTASLSSATSSRESSPAPGVTPGGGPKYLRDLSPSQLHIQVRYFYVGRDPTTILESDPVHCTVCAKSGHVKKYCPSVTCSSCGAFKDHFTHSCPRSQRCSRCRGRHHMSSCNLKLKPDNVALVCDLCGEFGHEEGDCELRWRSSGPIWKEPLPYNLNLQCYECGGRTPHLGNDCPQRRPGKVQGSSMWSQRGLPRPVQDIKNLSSANFLTMRPQRQRGPPGPKHGKPGKAAKKAKPAAPLRRGRGSPDSPIDLDSSTDDERAKYLRQKHNATKPFIRPSVNNNNGNTNAKAPMRILMPGNKQEPAQRPYPPPDRNRHAQSPPPSANFDDSRYRGYSVRDDYSRGNYGHDGARRRSRSRSPPRRNGFPAVNMAAGGQTYRPGNREGEIFIRGRAERFGR